MKQEEWTSNSETDVLRVFEVEGIERPLNTNRAAKLTRDFPKGSFFFRENEIRNAVARTRQRRPCEKSPPDLPARCLAAASGKRLHHPQLDIV